jgi:Xaa-Pro dipeptidase
MAAVRLPRAEPGGAVTLLGLGKTTRRGFVLIPMEGAPVALVHAIEASAWRSWPFERRVYSGWRELEHEFARPPPRESDAGRDGGVAGGRRADPRPTFPPEWRRFLLELGLEIASSGDLVSRFHSVWTTEQRDDHGRAAEVVADVAHRAFERAAEAVRAGTPTTEGALSEWIRSALREHGLVDQIDCIVAIGPRASDSHYAPVGAGETIEAGTLLLIDLWGAFEGSVAADQTWMGYLGAAVDDRTQEIWEAVRDARDAALAFLRESFDAGRQVRGRDVDDVARGLIAERGFGDYFVHRTGHSIDTELHGTGPNLDNLETRDDRLPGAREWGSRWSRASTSPTRSACGVRGERPLGRGRARGHTVGRAEGDLSAARRVTAADASRVDVALPLPIHRTFTYRVEGPPPAAGTRVLVPFQRSERIGWVVGPGEAGPIRGLQERAVRARTGAQRAGGPARALSLGRRLLRGAARRGDPLGAPVGALRRLA